MTECRNAAAPSSAATAPPVAASVPPARAPAVPTARLPLPRYDRARDLARLVPLWPHEIADGSAAGRSRLVKLLRRALREERQRGLAGHWAYDLARHAALHRAFQHEVAELGGAAAAAGIDVARIRGAGVVGTGTVGAGTVGAGTVGSGLVGAGIAAADIAAARAPGRVRPRASLRPAVTPARRAWSRGPSSSPAVSGPRHSSVPPSDSRAAVPTWRDTRRGSACSACADAASTT